MTTRAFGLISGGLDSILAARVLVDQGVDVTGIAFRSHFFGTRHAEAATAAAGIPIRIVDFSVDHFRMVQSPPHGYGANMNPCIDCHALMFRFAGEIMMKEGADCLFSGEVLGQRPMSQNRQSLDLVARESGYGDYIIRPLSARLLPETMPEKEGLVDRSRLLDICGRSRRRQLVMAERWGISGYSPPAGGCLLTDPIFARRLKDLFEHIETVDGVDVDLLKTGRHFRLGPDIKIIVGRKEAENERLLEMARPSDIVMEVWEAPGPTILVCGESDQETLELAARICVRYSDARAESGPVTVLVTIDGREEILQVLPLPKGDEDPFRI